MGFPDQSPRLEASRRRSGCAPSLWREVLHETPSVRRAMCLDRSCGVPHSRAGTHSHANPHDNRYAKAIAARATAIAGTAGSVWRVLMWRPPGNARTADRPRSFWRPQAPTANRYPHAVFGCTLDIARRSAGVRLRLQAVRADRHRQDLRHRVGCRTLDKRRTQHREEQACRSRRDRAGPGLGGTHLDGGESCGVLGGGGLPAVVEGVRAQQLQVHEPRRGDALNSPFRHRRGPYAANACNFAGSSEPVDNRISVHPHIVGAPNRTVKVYL